MAQRTNSNTADSLRSDSGSGAPRRVSVIGAGVVGVSTALYLQRYGHEVTIYDPGEPGSGASYGNAGIIATQSAVPIVMPGILKRIPSMLMDPDGPLKIRPQYLARISPWLVQLVLATRPKKIERTSAALAALLGSADEAYSDLLQVARASKYVKPVGRLKLFSTETGYEASATAREISLRRGAQFEVLNKDEISELEPNLAPIFERGVFEPGCSFVTNPKKMVQCFAEAFVRAGGKIVQEAVQEIRDEDPRHIVTANRSTSADVVVIAAGAWSRQLCKGLGIQVPLDTERGYHLMLPHPEAMLNRPVYWSEYYLNLCPMDEGVRMTTGVEFGGLEAPADFRRIRRLIPKARQMYPALSATPTSQWLGFRPSLPDSLPVVGAVPGTPGVFVAFGHQHLGLTLGPVTGKIVADMVSGRDPGVDLTPFQINRSFWR